LKHKYKKAGRKYAPSSPNLGEYKMNNTKFPRVEVEATFFVVTLDGVDLGTFSAYQIQQSFEKEDGCFEFEQCFN
jgi:hypothetical protein